MGTSVRDQRGFSLVEILMVVALLGIVAAMAKVVLQPALDSMRLNDSARGVERELQSARLKAVSSNRRLRVRTNCPAAPSFRIVEVLGTAADTAANRCSDAAADYPYPARDTDPTTVPNLDGPVRHLSQGATVTNATIEFRPDGTAWTVDAVGTPQAIPVAGMQLIVTRLAKTKAISVNALGKILLQ